MSMAAEIRAAVEKLGAERLWADSKSLADYAARLAREQGQALRQRKLETGGWELRVARRSTRRQSNLF